MNASPPDSTSAGRVCAIVVTYNRKQLLAGCLRALQDQTRPPDHILIVDNASTDGTPDEVAREFPDVEVLRLSDNLGGSGGFHAGFKHAYAQGFEWLWAMDDDGIPNPDCLELLLAHAGPNIVVIPQQSASWGKHGILAWAGATWIDLDAQTKVPLKAPDAPPVPEKRLLFTFVGPLIPRSLVTRVGFPAGDYFIWFDDFEYAMRIRRFTKARFVVVPEALMNHGPAMSQKPGRLLGVGKPKMRQSFASWRAYYMSRNSLRTLLRTRGRPRDTLLFLVREARLMLGVLLYDDDRFERCGQMARGLFDGALGRMGKRH